MIELLVVIAIIAILAAILFPVFAQARAKARQAACVSNCKQIGYAVMMYLQDYDETFPKGYAYALPAGNGFGKLDNKSAAASWPSWFGPYVKTAAVFICPDSPADISHLQKDNWGINDTMGYNYDGLTQDINNPPRSLADLSEPADTFVIFDSGDSTMCAGTNTWASMLENLDLDWGKLTNAQPFRHQKRASMVYADGHAKTIDYTTMLTRKADNVPPWMTEWRDCSPLCKTPVFGKGKDFDPAKLP